MSHRASAVAFRISLAVAAVLAIASAARAQCPSTPGDIEGPYYRAGSPYRTNFRRASDTTNLLVIRGRVLDPSCRPIPFAWLDFWQADATGVYDNTSAEYRYRGHQFADADGNYALYTILPGLYPGRPRHVHVKVQGATTALLTTQLYFADATGIPEALRLHPQPGPDGVPLATFDFVLPANAPCASPRIAAQPSPATVALGGAASFSVSASGTTPIDFHWRRDGVPLDDGGGVSGARTSTIAISGATCTDAAAYDCVVSSSCGSETSASAALTIPGCDDPPCAVLRGNVDTGPGGSGPANVLFVNGSAGDACGLVRLGPSDAIALDVLAPPSRAGHTARYWVGAWIARPTNTTAQVLPAGLGSIGMPMALTGGSPRPRFLANNLPNSDKELGSETWPGPPTRPAPYRLFELPAGLGHSGVALFFQGIERDERSSASRPYAVTNGIRLEIAP